MHRNRLGRRSSSTPLVSCNSRETTVAKYSGLDTPHLMLITCRHRRSGWGILHRICPRGLKLTTLLLAYYYWAAHPWQSTQGSSKTCSNLCEIVSCLHVHGGINCPASKHEALAVAETAGRKDDLPKRWRWQSFQISRFTSISRRRAGAAHSTPPNVRLQGPTFSLLSRT